MMSMRGYGYEIRGILSSITVQLVSALGERGKQNTRCGSHELNFLFQPFVVPVFCFRAIKFLVTRPEMNA